MSSHAVSTSEREQTQWALVRRSLSSPPYSLQSHAYDHQTLARISIKTLPFARCNSHCICSHCEWQSVNIKSNCCYAMWFWCNSIHKIKANMWCLQNVILLIESIEGLLTYFPNHLVCIWWQRAVKGHISWCHYSSLKW